MQMKSLAMLAIAGCAIGMLTGCGVPQEEVDAMVAQMTSEREQSEADLKGKIADTESLLNSEKERTRTLQNDLRDSAVLNEELKENNKEMKSELATANSKISSLESSLASAKARITTAESTAADAERERATMELEAAEARTRFEGLIANLIALNKIKPEDVGFDYVSVPSQSTSSMGSDVDMGEGMDMGTDTDMGSGTESGSEDSVQSLLDQMGDL